MDWTVKLLPLYSTAFLLFWLGFAAHYGRAYRLTNDVLMLEHHKSGIAWSAGALILTIALIEMVVHEAKAPRSPLFVYHLPAALGTLGIFILMASWVTGLRHKVAHRMLARALMVCLIIAAGTGGVILARM